LTDDPSLLGPKNIKNGVCGERADKEGNKKMTEQNERQHGGFSIAQLITDITEHLGIVLVAEAGHGKSFTAFTIVKEALKNPENTVLVFSPSTIWRRNFGAINCVRVGTNAFNPIIENPKVALEPIPTLRDTIFVNLDKKWIYVKTGWLEQLLTSKQSLLFEIKYRNGRRIKAFESLVLSFIYEMQERELENPEYKRHYLIVLEEAQNAFGTYSMNSDDSLELFTIFTQSRSDANIHYIAIGQRLNDISTKVIERLRPLVGLTLGENSLRKIKAMVPDELKPRIQTLQKRQWIYLDGKTNPEFTVPTFKKEGKPTILKPTVTEKKPEKKTSKLGTLGKLAAFIWHMALDPVRGGSVRGEVEPETEEEREEREFEEDDDELEEDIVFKLV
jgi:hypothetical protein